MMINPKWTTVTDEIMIDHVHQSPCRFEALNRWSEDVRESLAQHAGVPSISVAHCVARWKNVQRKALRHANAKAEKELTQARQADDRKACMAKKVQAVQRGVAVRAAMRTAAATAGITTEHLSAAAVGAPVLAPARALRARQPTNFYKPAETEKRARRGEPQLTQARAPEHATPTVDERDCVRNHFNSMSWRCDFGPWDRSVGVWFPPTAGGIVSRRASGLVPRDSAHLCAGGGGDTTGAVNAGFKVKVATDMLPAAVKTPKHAHRLGDSAAFVADMNDEDDRAAVIKAARDGGAPGVTMGGPLCKGLSGMNPERDQPK